MIQYLIALIVVIALVLSIICITRKNEKFSSYTCTNNYEPKTLSDLKNMLDKISVKIPGYPARQISSFNNCYKLPKNTEIGDKGFNGNIGYGKNIFDYNYSTLWILINNNTYNYFIDNSSYIFYFYNIDNNNYKLIFRDMSKP